MRGLKHGDALYFGKFWVYAYMLGISLLATHIDHIDTEAP